MISWETLLFRLVLATILGGIIGLERERKDWSAGMRTHMMVCLGAALTIIVSSFGFSEALEMDNVVLDPARIAAQVISGIGFLGAGIIMFLKPGFIRGLTTASGLWTVAAIGLAVGAGLYIAAVSATIIAFIILLILQPLERRFARRFKQNFVRISINPSANPHKIIEGLMDNVEHDISTFSFNKSEKGYLIEIRFEEFDIHTLTPILIQLEKDDRVTEVYWTK